MHKPPRCSDVARATGLDLPGTAPLARAYLLVEYSGPWPAKAFADNVIDPASGRRIVQRTAAAAIRPLFIRRHGSHYEPDRHEFRWAYVDAVAGVTTWHRPAMLAEIADAPWPDESAMTDTSGRDPFYLVCTNGRRDQCCATRGRPVAAAFAQLRPEHTWECSHVGGHRLAGIVVALPRGDIYGLVNPDDAHAIVAATDGGKVHVPRLRGSCLDEPEVQVAKLAVMRAASSASNASLRLVGSEQGPDNAWTVILSEHDNPADRSALTVTCHRTWGPEAPASCGKDPEPVATWVTDISR